MLDFNDYYYSESLEDKKNKLIDEYKEKGITLNISEEDLEPLMLFELKNLLEIKLLLSKGSEEGIDISDFSKKDIDFIKYDKRRVSFLLGIKRRGIDISDLVGRDLSDKKLEFCVRHKIIGNHNVVKLVPLASSDKHLDVLEYCLFKNIISESIKYFKKGFSVKKLFLVVKGIEEGLAVSWYANNKFNYKQMQLIRNGLLSGLDVSLYAKEFYSADLMQEIYNAMSLGVKITNLPDDVTVGDFKKALEDVIYFG